MSTFTYHGRTLNRFDHLYNSTAISERGVEVAVAVDFLANAEPPNNRLEVGNVLQHYEDAIQYFPRNIVDLYEVAWGVENIDVFDIEGEYDQIVSISTVEHVGFDYDPPLRDGPQRAIEHLRSCLSETGTLLVTFGMGFNPSLDAHTKELSLAADRSTYLSRQHFSEGPGSWIERGWASEWVESDFPINPYYGTVTPWANTVWIGEFGPK